MVGNTTKKASQILWLMCEQILKIDIAQNRADHDADAPYTLNERALQPADRYQATSHDNCPAIAHISMPFHQD